MPLDLAIPQAVLLLEPSGVRMVAKSDDFPPELEPLAVAAVERFGPRPEGVAIPAAHAVLSLGKRFTGVFQYADSGQAVAFRLLALNRKLYDEIADPFAVAARFPPDYAAFGSLPPLTWPPDPHPPRTVAEVADILKGDGPTLLGGAQGLLDGVKIVVPRPAPDDTLLRKLWKLLPHRERAELRFATFAYRLDERLNYCVLPTPPDPLPFGWVAEAKVGDQPEGRYELALQLAAESGNQREVDRLFLRRGSRDTLRLALILVAVMLGVLLASKWFFR